MRNSKHETIADVVAEMLEFAETDSQTIGRDVLRRRIQKFAKRIEAAHHREVAELKSKMNDVVCENEALRDACGTCGAKREVAELRECLKETMVIAIAEYHYNSCFKHVKCGEIERCKTCKVVRWRKALQYEGGAK